MSLALTCAAPVADAQGGTVSYTYDALGRVATAYYPDGTCLAYSYDLVGNRTQYNSSMVGPPVANPVSAGTWQDLATTFDPRGSNLVCGSLTVAAVGAPSHGTATIVTGGGGVIYTPNTSYFGADSFTYQLSNGHTTSATGTITVSVQLPTLPPTAQGGNAMFYGLSPVQPNVTTDISTLISDPYGYPLTISNYTNGTQGTVFSGGVQKLSYQYNSIIKANRNVSDSYTYTVSDGHGHTATATVAVSISVTTNQ